MWGEKHLSWCREFRLHTQPPSHPLLSHLPGSTRVLSASHFLSLWSQFPPPGFLPEQPVKVKEGKAKEALNYLCKASFAALGFTSASGSEESPSGPNL